MLEVHDIDSDRPCYFIPLVFGFGAINAVLSFSIVARHPQILISIALHIPVTHFSTAFESSFPIISPHLLSLDSCLFGICGWEVNLGDDNLLPPSPTFCALGTLFDLSKVGVGILTVGNKPGRVEDIASTLTSRLPIEYVDSTTVASTLSKVVFAESFLDSQCGSIRRKRIRACDSDLGSSIRVTAEFKHAVSMLLKYVQSSPPHTHTP